MIMTKFYFTGCKQTRKKRKFMINVCACARIFVFVFENVCAHEAMQSWVVEWELAVAVEKSILWLLFFLLSSFCFLFFIFSLCIFLCLIFVLSSGVFRCFSICLSLRIFLFVIFAFIFYWTSAIMHCQIALFFPGKFPVDRDCWFYMEK